MPRHYTREALTRLLSGPADPHVLDRAVDHLVQCRRCRNTAAGCLAEAGAASLPVSTAGVRSALQVVVQAGPGRLLEALRAESWWADLRSLTPVKQVKKIRSTAALQSLAVFEACLAEARDLALTDPFAGEATARVAWTLADLLPEPRYAPELKNDLRGEAMTVMANCRRLAADWLGSVAAIDEARQYLALGTRDPALEAGLLSIHSSLCMDIGEMDKALNLVRRSVEIYRELEDDHGVSHAVVQEANCLLAAVRPAEALERAGFALDRLSPHEVRLKVLAKFIQVESLVLLGRPREALSPLAEAKRLYRPKDTELRLRGLYFQAIVLDATGHPREAENLLRGNIKAYLDQEQYKEVFTTLLTLFECLCRRGALRKAAALCEEAIAVTSEAGEACNPLIRRAWEELLATVRVRQLSEEELVQARQYLVRHWSGSKGGPFALPRLEAAVARIAEASAPPPPLPPPLPAIPSAPTSLRAVREAFNEQQVRDALQATGGNVSEASRILGMSRTTVLKRKRLYGL